MKSKNHPYGCFDSNQWADEWIKTIKKNPSIPTDWGTMISWFASAIMTGYDRGRWEAEKIMKRKTKRSKR